ncbi:MAG TPA: enolase C-terminal domain-like protein [Vicinamibacterales bacterium]|nr:enolase C-terminal domain-like protein [Vicinamibacterales bacterium]
MDRTLAHETRIERVTAEAFTIPTDRPESDGTLEWRSTTLVLVQTEAAGRRGLGYTYAATAAAAVIRDTLAPLVTGQDAMDTRGVWDAMTRAVRNAGRPGIASHAIAAVDSALWDLKARILDVPLARLLGMARPDVPVYGSGGFTSYTDADLQDQLGAWVETGISRVKMKVGREPERDVTRVGRARAAIGPDVALYVDANGAYERAQALAQAERFAEHRVSWFEEPVSSDDLDGLRLLRDRSPAGMAIAAGEYGYDATYFRRMLQAGAVDVLQADATRCAGITGFMQAGALCDAFHVPLSAHTAPALHLAPCAALACVRDIEYFHDHVRIERALFDGCPVPRNGHLQPDLSGPGFGLTFKRSDAERYAVT